MIAAGLSASMADKVIADRARKTAKDQHAYAASKEVEAPLRILGMTVEQEESAARFMDEMGELHKGVFRPSDVWIIGYLQLSTAHLGPMLAALRPREYPKQIELPCSLDHVLDFGARPALTEDEAMHRANSFAQDVLDRARSLYRDGYFADPFTERPKPRPPDFQP